MNFHETVSSSHLGPGAREKFGIMEQLPLTSGEFRGGDELFSDGRTL